jgi:hypothetical protein
VARVNLKIIDKDWLKREQPGWPNCVSRKQAFCRYFTRALLFKIGQW